MAKKVAAGAAKPKITTRYFRIEWETSEQLLAFFKEVVKTCVKAKYFRAGIGEIYLVVTGADDPNCEFKIVTVEDVIFDFRKKGIRLLRTLKDKPRPEKSFRGEWMSVSAFVDAHVAVPENAII